MKLFCSLLIQQKPLITNKTHIMFCRHLWLTIPTFLFNVSPQFIEKNPENSGNCGSALTFIQTNKNLIFSENQDFSKYPIETNYKGKYYKSSGNRKRPNLRIHCKFPDKNVVSENDILAYKKWFEEKGSRSKRTGRLFCTIKNGWKVVRRAPVCGSPNKVGDWENLVNPTKTSSSNFTTLRAAVENNNYHFSIGTAMNYNKGQSAPEKYWQLSEQNFNLMTAENQCKPIQIIKGNDKNNYNYDVSKCISMAEKAKNANQLFRGHVLFWPSPGKYPSFIENSAGDAAFLQELFEEYLEEVVIDRGVCFE